MVDLESDIKNCVGTLLKGGTILYPTDTVWGLGCDALNEAAVEKIFTIKQRPKEKSMIILLADAREVLQYVAAPPPDIIAIIESFDRPTTVIYDGALGFPDNVVNKDGSIAIRVTTDPFCKALIKRFRKPLVSTSANISGRPTPSIYSMIDSNIIINVNYVVTHRQNDDTIGAPSRIVRINDDGEIDVIRA
ncbi:MAG: Sua5/YciO/YrdC/YwlC family protein [Flavipsychrobacter sp.]|jgi:L-threonylcarbamoyladenylate synthase|nr:Sua5/YciO/YrdC/YwlC family protein [Flavipsychrobacter sp.]